MSADVSTFKYNFRAPASKVPGSIKYAIGQTASSKLLVARSEVGICAIFLASGDDQLLAQLAEAFPRADRIRAQAELYRDLGHVVAFIDKDSANGLVELDVGGTAFQQKVWQALCGIPVGETRTYSDIARHLGVPEAVRAVAGACAANLLAVAIPCHRVVRSDGSISGYRWGVERKRELLAKEGAK